MASTLTDQDFVTIAQSGTLTELFGVSNSFIHGIWAPVVDSCQIFLRGSFDTKSENFLRVVSTELTDPSASSAFDVDWRWDIGPGSEAILLSENLGGFPNCKLETSVAQTSVRTLVVLKRFN